MPSLSASLIALALLVAPDAQWADCGNAADRNRAAVAKVVEALRSYEGCLAASAKAGVKGGDCAAEIEALDNAHDNFADAVDDAKDCR